MTILLLPLNPMPAPRPRVTSKGWTYYPKRYKVWRDQAAALIPAALKEAGIQTPYLGALDVSVDFIVRKPKSTRFTYPRGDCDNYFKSLDCLNGLAWEDDQRIVSFYACKRWADPGEDGHIILSIKEVDTWP